MEALKPFVQSDIGSLFCIVLIVMGIADFVVSGVIFGKKAKTLAATIQPTMSPAQKKPIEQQVKTMNIIVLALRVAGGIFICIGIFGLTYKF